MQLKPTMRYAKDKSGTGVIVKRVRPRSDELLILQHLHSVDSLNNHTISLLQTFNLDKGTFFFVPEGTPLDHGFTFGRFSSNNTVNFSQQLVEGVAFLHGHSIAHLDIKPSNIVVRRNRLFIIDFDISVRVDGPDTMIDRWRGTPVWMALEIGKNQDGPRCFYSPIRADLWSCGLVLQYLASKGAGEENPYEALTRDLLNKDPRRPPLLNVRSDYGKVSADDMMTDDRSCRTVFLA
jgi:serine/threonine protein kinase